MRVNMPHRVERNAYRLTEQWCKAVEDKVILVLKGSVFGDLIKGTIEECKKADCQARRRSPYCLIGSQIQVKLEHKP
jgi:hypothetical protein